MLRGEGRTHLDPPPHHPRLGPYLLAPRKRVATPPQATQWAGGVASTARTSRHIYASTAWCRVKVCPPSRAARAQPGQRAGTLRKGPFEEKGGAATQLGCRQS